MRFFARSIWLASLLGAQSALATLSFEVTATSGDQELDASALVFEPIPLRRHQQHSASSPYPRGKEHREPISYSSNWCGASQHSQNDPVNEVFGHFTAPDLTLRPGIAPPQFAAAWIGIDGAICKKSLLQGGVTTILNSNGGQSASAWWEWYPEAAYSIKNLPVKAGDWMSVNITLSSPTSATIVITNLQQGYTYNIRASNGPELCRVDAEWIVEDFYDANGQVPFAMFSELWFLDTVAGTAGGKSIGIDGATMVHLQNDTGAVVCSASRWDNSNFVVESH